MENIYINVATILYFFPKRLLFSALSQFLRIVQLNINFDCSRLSVSGEDRKAARDEATSRVW